MRNSSGNTAISGRVSVVAAATAEVGSNSIDVIASRETRDGERTWERDGVRAWVGDAWGEEEGTLNVDAPDDGIRTCTGVVDGAMAAPRGLCSGVGDNEMNDDDGDNVGGCNGGNDEWDDADGDIAGNDVTCAA